MELFKFVDETIDSSSNYKVTIERLNKNTYSRSFCIYKSDKKIDDEAASLTGLTRQIVSYLNAVVKLGVANRKLKTNVTEK